jgi:hypothetical protein
MCRGDPMAAPIAPVFLSASEPNPDRDPAYWETRNVVNLREAVRAFCAHVLPNFPLVFGGHPAITPFVRSAAQRIAYDLELDAKSDEETATRELPVDRDLGPGEQARLKRPQVVIFQSQLFLDRKKEEDEVFTPPLDKDGKEQPPRNGWRNESLLLMRYEMLGKPIRGRPVAVEHIDNVVRPYVENFGQKRDARVQTLEFSAAVFIGGMEGVQREFHIFRSFHPDAPTFPIVSTGSACKSLLGEVRGNLDPELVTRLERDTAYPLLMQQILPLREAPAIRWRVTDVAFHAELHRDPDGINDQFIDGVPQKKRPQSRTQ